MSISNGIVSDGLIFHFDAANPKSYPGEATTNLISQVNAYPSVGNGWGTYNVNQYNGAKYFSIGTVSGVSDNVVTMTAAHPLRTYDVVTPQSTGGGLTAGTNYYIKKVSTTQFSVHQYISTQDGSVGFGCLANIQSNTKISINSTNFPTMWWGPPHLANSGIIKTISPDGFNFEGRKHDCLRHHAYRPDSVVDGMAYGVNPTIGAGVTHTISCMMRAVSADSVYINWQAYWAGSTPQSAILFAGNVTRKWTKYTYTKTTIAGATYLILYWLNQTGKSAIDISEIQVELNKDHATLFTVGTRDGNGVDLVSGTTLTFTGTIQDTDKSILFDGSDDYISIPNINLGNGNLPWTCGAWIKTTTAVGNTLGAGSILSNSSSGPVYSMMGVNSGKIVYWTYQSSAWSQKLGVEKTVNDGVWHLLTWVNYSDYTMDMYVDGLIDSNVANSTSGNNNPINMLGGSWSYKFAGNISQVSIYNRALSPTEILQNYNALKGRFGL